MTGRLKASRGLGVAAGLALALTGCGSSSPALNTSSRATGFANETPAEILVQSARTADSAKSFRISGELHTSDIPASRLTLAVVYPSRLSVSIVRGRTQEQVIVVPGGVDIRANLPYWSRNLPEATARHYADRWLTLTGSAGTTLTKQFQALLRVFTARSVACELARFPHPTRVGTRTVAGQASVELHSSGPSGRDSETAFIATAVPHLPLEQDITRPTPEPALRSCPGAAGAQAGSGQITYSDWNAVTITAPAHTTSIP